MPNVIKRLGLGIFLILAASAILLVADRNHRSTASSSAPSKVHRIAVLQHANTPVLDDSIRGTIDALAERGYRDGDTLTIEKFNAQGDMAWASIQRPRLRFELEDWLRQQRQRLKPAQPAPAAASS